MEENKAMEELETLAEKRDFAWVRLGEEIIVQKVLLRLIPKKAVISGFETLLVMLSKKVEGKET